MGVVWGVGVVVVVGVSGEELRKSDKAKGDGVLRWGQDGVVGVGVVGGVEGTADVTGLYLLLPILLPSCCCCCCSLLRDEELW